MANHPKHVVRYRDLCALSGLHFVPTSLREWLYRHIDPNDEQQVRHVIRKRILPRLKEIDDKFPGSYERLKHSLKYYLNTQRFPAEDVYDAEEPAFNPPDDLMNYYRWAWAEIAPAENYADIDLKNYVEEPDQGRP